MMLTSTDGVRKLTTSIVNESLDSHSSDAPPDIPYTGSIELNVSVPIRVHTQSRWLRSTSTIVAIIGMFGVTMLVIVCNVCVSDRKVKKNLKLSNENIEECIELNVLEGESGISPALLRTPQLKMKQPDMVKVHSDGFQTIPL